ncbi:MAG: type IX secretion system membrane protein PorP/SprF [bacterium]|nr:type IX secretion system membrane protein PorP/SprF [bacterium]
MKKLLVTCLFLFYVNLVKGQDPTNTSFQYGRLEYNPSYGGGDGPGKIGIRSSSRTSFYPVRGPFSYSTFSMDYSPCKESLGRIGLGLLATNETQGDGFLKINKVAFNFGIGIPINKHSAISAGFRPGLVFQNVDWNEFIFSDQLDPIRGIMQQPSSNQNANLDLSTVTNWDFGLRYNLYNSKAAYFMAGIGVFNAFEPQIGLLNRATLPRRFSLQLSLLHKSKLKDNISYHFYFRGDLQNNFKYGALNFETYFGSKISAGAGLKLPLINPYGVKNNLYPSLLFGYQANPVFKIYAAVETNVMGVNIAGKTSSFEVGIVLINNKKVCGLNDMKDLYKYDFRDKSQPLNCPRFRNTDGKIETF